MAVGIHIAGLDIASVPIVAPELRALFDYWVELAEAASGLPPVSAFDPVRVPGLLSNIWIVEVDAESRRLRIRLAGESINAIYRRGIGGRFLAELCTPQELPEVVARYRRAIVEPAAFHTAGYVYKAAGQYCLGERLALPMIGRDGRTSTVIGATIYSGYLHDRTEVRLTGDKAHFLPVKAANHEPVEIAGG